MSTLERAIAIANEAHRFDTDKAGAPYILHPFRVMQRVRDAGGREAELIAAVLHDVVEDSPWTLERLRKESFAPEVVDIVDALTKRGDEKIPEARKWDPEPYYRFTRRAAQTRASRIVKRADLLDNLDTTRLGECRLKDWKRIVRYRRARGMLEVIGRAAGDDTLTAPAILPLRNRVCLHKVESSCPGEHPIVVCDFHVDGAERGIREPGGVRLSDRVFCVDHHASLEQFYSGTVTSTSLAHQYVARVGAERARGSWILINHTDCDSVLSSAVLLGHVAPSEDLVRSSIAADHTGEEDPVADLLQGLDESRRGRRTEAQYFESLRNLQILMTDGEAGLEPAARQAMSLRRLRRQVARHAVASGEIQREGPLAWGILDVDIDGAFLPSLLPDAALILLIGAHPRHPDRRAVRLRLGPAAPAGLTLHSLGIAEMDPQFGGRWNAGSNKRGGGTMLSPEEYVAGVRERLESVMS